MDAHLSTKRFLKCTGLLSGIPASLRKNVITIYNNGDEGRYAYYPTTKSHSKGMVNNKGSCEVSAAQRSSEA